ncbi:ATP-dependent DNA ligase [Microbacterium sp.]|uniref:ATP-dependent DNA ligase n=1 Tax=Microbacterium sp. TaxID=51671 RepID=UPI0039E71D4C
MADAPRRASPQTVEVAGRRLRVSNLDKVLYPETGTTKGEVVDYYARIAPLLLPHVAGRPVTRKRWPEGVESAPFFAKALEAGAPSWIPRRPIAHSSGSKDYPLIEETAALVYFAQTASLELHVPQWRFTPEGDRGRPDRLVLDLDPGPGVGLVECAQVARWARAVLSDLGMDAVPVTSGSKGIHLYTPLDGSRTSEQISAFAHELARALEADHGDLVVSQMSKAARPGRVFLDWSQNNAAKTTIAPYSLRGRAQPTVAAPRTWAELDDVDLRHLTFAEVLQRADDASDTPPAPSPRAARTSSADALAPYLAKRSADKTPEPMPSPGGPAVAEADGTAARFVIQEHHARRLHYDLRLERDGVLMSWAVPRGVPETGAQNHLAVMTEPHPMEYLNFHGEIPQGQYGAGTMTIWDVGTYATEKWRDDEVIVTLRGRETGPLGEARLALIRTGGEGEKSQWLLHRMTPEPATPSGRAHHRPSAPASRSHRRPPANGEDGPAIAPMLATPSTPESARLALRRWSAPWVEFKWDGVRAIGTWDGQRLRLTARSGTDITDRYPELSDVDAGFGPIPCVVDGEIVALDASGRPSFTRLQNRMHLASPGEIRREMTRTPVQYFLFDLLSHGGTDASPLPLAQRRELLEAVASDTIEEISVPPVVDDLDVALATAEELDLEGAVVKDPESPYRPGRRSEQWLKVKRTHTLEVVIGAIRPGKGGRAGQIGSLLVGIPGPDGLRYAGRVGSGFSDRTLRMLDGALAPLRSATDPFVGTPAADAADALWVRPRLVAEVEFAELTPDGILRHARWRGLRSDISADDLS